MMKKSKLYWRIWNWYHFNSPIYVELNFLKPLRTWWKARKAFKFPKISFRYGGINDILSGSIFHATIGCAKWFHLEFNDVFWKYKFDDIRYESEPCIKLVLFNKWKLLWIFECPKIANNEWNSNYIYWETILDYVYTYNKDIVKTKENFAWVSWKRLDDGSELKKSCWTDKWLTNEAKELFLITKK